MTHSLRTLIAVTTLCLGTTIAPTAAVEPPAPAKAPRNAAERVVDRVPGALLEAQMDLTRRQLEAALTLYVRLTGGWPLDAGAFLELGLIDLLPGQPDGEPMQLVPQDHNLLPPPGVIGVRLRLNDIALIAAGANGDPLAPIIKTIESKFYIPAMSESILDRDRRRAMLLEGALEEWLRMYQRATGRLPESRAELEALLPMVPVQSRWLTTAQSPTLGCRWEVDGARQLLRFSRFPDPGYANTVVLRAEQSPYAKLSAAPWLDQVSGQWQAGATLELLPHRLSTLHFTPADPAIRNALRQGIRLAVGSQIVLNEMAFFATQHQVRTGALPDIEALAQHVPLLHRPLHPLTGDSLPIVTLPEQSVFPPDFAPYPEAQNAIALAYCSKSPSPSPSPALCAAVPENSLPPPASGTRVSSFPGMMVCDAYLTYSGWCRSRRSALDPGETELADDCLKGGWPALSPELRAWLWPVLAHQDTEFAYSYGLLLAEQLARTLVGWQSRSPQLGAQPPDWSTVLADLNCIPGAYRIVPTADFPLEANMLACSLALDASGLCYRLQLRSAGGAETLLYGYVHEDPGFPVQRLAHIDPRSYPELTRLEFRDLVYAVCPVPAIPLPPAGEATP